jgi:hypothetical protein
MRAYCSHSAGSIAVFQASKCACWSTYPAVTPTHTHTHAHTKCRGCIHKTCRRAQPADDLHNKPALVGDQHSDYLENSTIWHSTPPHHTHTHRHTDARTHTHAHHTHTHTHNTHNTHTHALTHARTHARTHTQTHAETHHPHHP